MVVIRLSFSITSKTAFNNIYCCLVDPDRNNDVFKIPIEIDWKSIILADLSPDIHRHSIILLTIDIPLTESKKCIIFVRVCFQISTIELLSEGNKHYTHGLID